MKDPPAEGDKADAKSETAAAKADVAPAKTDGVEAEVDLAADPTPAEGAEATADPNAALGMGMMAGMPGAPPKPKEIKYQPTVWGRYAKLLLSSTEFLFIN